MTFSFYKKVNLVKLTLGIALSSSLFSCGDFLNGKPKKEPYLEIKNESVSCVKDISVRMKAMLKSNVTDTYVDETFACLDQVLVEFQNRVQGTADANVFSRNDLYQIFEKFLSEAQISTEATSDILRLKAALIGGSDQNITKSELTALKSFLKIMKEEVKKLLPYSMIFNFKKGQREYSKDAIKNAFDQLSDSLKKLFSLSSIHRSDYRFDDLKKLTLNLNLFDEEEGDFLELASEINDVLTGNDPLKTESDYKIFITSLTDVLKIYTLSLQNYVLFEITDSAELKSVFEFIDGIINILENSNQFKKNKIIASENLDPLISRLARKNLITLSVTDKTLVEFYKTLLVRVFESGPNADVSLFAGVKKIHFINLKKEINLFKGYVSFVDQLPFPKPSAENRNGGLDISVVQKKMKDASFDSLSESFKNFDHQAQAQMTNAFEEIKVEFLQDYPVVYRHGKVVVAANQEMWRQNWSDLIHALYGKMLARELLIGWGNGIATRSVKDAVITESGLVKWYSEFKQFGKEIKAFDPRTVNAGARSFKEANLFTVAANGDNQMDYLETVQYVNVLIAAGGTSFMELKNGMAMAHCQLPEKDVFGFSLNQESCVVDELKKNYKLYFNNLSYLVAYLKTLDHVQTNKFFESIMDMARTDKMNKGQKVETADLRALSVLLHYIESLYSQFDRDKSWSLSADELRLAYPRFKSFAAEFAVRTAKDKLDIFTIISSFPLAGYNCFSQDDLIREAFIFLLFNGKTPGATDYKIAPCLRNVPLIDVNGEMSRLMMINTFKIFKDVLGS